MLCQLFLPIDPVVDGVRKGWTLDSFLKDHLGLSTRMYTLQALEYFQCVKEVFICMQAVTACIDTGNTTMTTPP